MGGGVVLPQQHGLASHLHPMPRHQHPLRDATPEGLALWLDAYTIDGPEGYGRPGYAGLRDAWAGRRPHTEILDELEPWVARQLELQVKAEEVYAALDAVEPARGEVIPEWFPTRWSEILLAMPWDERLESAIAEGVTYLEARL